MSKLVVSASQVTVFPWQVIKLLCNRYCMVGSVLWIIKPMTPRAQPEGEGLYNP